MSYRRMITAALAAILILPIAVSAQSLKPGTWTGTAHPPGEAAVAITFDVKVAGDTIAITLIAGEHGSFKLEDIKVTSDKITFKFIPGPTVSCSLAKQDDGSFAGTCTDDGGGVATMTMIPPKSSPDPTADCTTVLRFRTDGRTKTTPMP